MGILETRRSEQDQDAIHISSTDHLYRAIVDGDIQSEFDGERFLSRHETTKGLTIGQKRLARAGGWIVIVLAHWLHNLAWKSPLNLKQRLTDSSPRPENPSLYMTCLLRSSLPLNHSALAFAAFNSLCTLFWPSLVNLAVSFAGVLVT